MAFSSSTALLAFVGISGIGIAGAASFYRAPSFSFPTRGAPSLATPSVGRFAGTAKSSRMSLGDPYQVPALPAPFTLRYRVYSKDDPQGQRYVTMSSEGSDLLILEEVVNPDQPRTSFALNRDHRSYIVFHSDSPNVRSNMWVTRSMVIETFPFVGADLPTIHPLLELTGAGKQTGTAWNYSAYVYEKGLPPERPFVKGRCSVSDLSNGNRAVSSIVIGTEPTTARVSSLSDYRQWNGVSLASIIVDSTYDRSKTAPENTVISWKKYVLQSKQSMALPSELFRPEHYLKEGDNVEYKIPKQAKMNLNFTYHENGTTIEDQANAQDLIELRWNH